MKPLLLAAGLLALNTFSPVALADPAGSCHFHGRKPATETVVSGCAEQRRDRLVNNGKLDPSWQDARLEKLELVDGRKGKEWKVMFSNPAASDASKQTLYLFFSHPGNFIAANFDGK